VRTEFCASRGVPLDSLSRPLAGRRIVVTRALEQAGELAASLEQLGAEVLLLPTLSFAPPEDLSSLDAAIARLSEFDWIFFTSPNAVRFFARRKQESAARATGARPANPKVGAVGPATAEAARKEGFRVDYVAGNHSGEALASELAQSIRGCRVLLPRSDRADQRLPCALREAGAQVTDAVAYRTAAPQKLDPQAIRRVRSGEVDTILFASPSAFFNLWDSIPASELADLSTRVPFAAIGPTTARALRDAGVRVEIEAVEASATALAQAIADYYRRQPSIARRS
jgi:uroporphyrinogen III methyltransferase/synthase